MGDYQMYIACGGCFAMDRVSQGDCPQDECGGIWPPHPRSPLNSCDHSHSPGAPPSLETVPPAQKSLQSQSSLSRFCSDGICVRTDQLESSLSKITHAKVTKSGLNAMTKTMPTPPYRVRSIEIEVPQKSLKLSIKL